MNFFRWIYWKRQAKIAQKKCRELEAQLKAEFYRNMGREDAMVSAAVFGSRGMYGIPPRTEAAHVPRKINPIARHANPYDALTTEEKMEFETVWRPDAEARNISVDAAKQQFAAVVAGRKTLNDEPLM